MGSDYIDGRLAYVIGAVPKRSDKYLFRGRVWVDAEDYAVVRVEGQPAKTASFWIHSTHFIAQYQKSGPFWYPSFDDQRYRRKNLRNYSRRYPLFRL